MTGEFSQLKPLTITQSRFFQGFREPSHPKSQPSQGGDIYMSMVYVLYIYNLDGDIKASQFDLIENNYHANLKQCGLCYFLACFS